MRLEDIIDYLNKKPTILDKKDNYLVLKKITQVHIEEITSNMDAFSCIMSDIEYSFQESFDWLHPEKEPKEFIMFLRKLEKGVTEPDYKIAVREFIEFFEWSKYPKKTEATQEKGD